MQFQFSPIGIVHSCFKEKFGIPRQPGLVPEARGVIELLPPFDRDEALRGLEGFSHLWIVFVFHQSLDQGWRPTVRPPRLGGNERIGVFATRSPFRPNPIGLSAVEFTGFGRDQGKLLLQLKGIDLVDGTPILDIKPYVPYTDNIGTAMGGFAYEPPGTALEVVFSEQVLETCRQREKELPDLRDLLRRLLQHDPRPAYHGQNSEAKIYGMRLFDFDVRWRVEDKQVQVLELRPVLSIP